MNILTADKFVSNWGSGLAIPKLLYICLRIQQVSKYKDEIMFFTVEERS